MTREERLKAIREMDEVIERAERACQSYELIQMEMMATLAGMRLYEKCGYVSDPAIDYPLPGGLTIRFVPMHKKLRPAP